MKKLFAVLLAVCMTLTMLCTTVFAAPVPDTTAHTGIDVVIVLDMTKSMDTEGDQNDKRNYRFDAAAMLVGMLDMEGSRVALIPFAAQPTVATELTSVMNVQERVMLVDQAYSLGETKPNTNIGAALMLANKLLDDRADTRNHPMIVLLTDGSNAINGEVQVEHSYRWDGSAIVDQGAERYSTATARQVTREAAECAAAKGYPIYAIGLGKGAAVDNASNGELPLRSISEMTGLRDGAYSVSSRNANTLPEFFARVLADRIGSSVQFSAMPRPVDGMRDTYEVNIPILNRSILETNIIVPLHEGTARPGILAENITLYNEAGVAQGETGGVTQLHGVRGKFAMIKIRKPNTVGMWKMRFTTDKGFDPAEIKFNVLYNYDITLQANATVGGQADTIYKTDRVRIEAEFVDRMGVKVNDSALYVDHSGAPEYEDWMTIRGSWSLVKADGAGRPITTEVVYSGDMTVDNTREMFVADMDLDQVHPLSGNYVLLVKAAGAGIDREVQIPLTLQNHAPVANDYDHVISVNSPEAGQEVTWTVDGTSGVLPMRADQIVTDTDGDELEFTLLPDSGENILDMRLNPDNSIAFTTRLSDVDMGGRRPLKSGTAKYALHYTDHDAGGSGSVMLTVRVDSVIHQFLESFTPEITVTGSNVAGSTDKFLKNTPVAVTLKLKAADGSYADEEKMQIVAPSLTVKDTTTGDNVVSSAEMEHNGNACEYTIETTGNKKADWDIVISVSPFDDQTMTIHIPNDHAPAPIAAANTRVGIDGDGVPGFLTGLLGGVTADDDPVWTVDAEALFTGDADNDILVYGAPAIYKAGSDVELDDTWVKAVPDGEDVYKLQVSKEHTGLFAYSYNVDVVVTATDGDGLVSRYVQSIMVESLHNKMMTFIIILVAALVALIILFLIVHQIRKPVFPALTLTFREEPSIFVTSTGELVPVKTPTNANACGVDSDMAAKHAISMRQLQNVIIKPIRSTVSVGVVCKTIESGHEVAINDQVCKPKKQYVWHIGEELTIANKQGEGLVAIKLETKDTMAEGADDFMNDDSWDSGETVPTAGTGRKTRKVSKRQAAPVEENTSSGNDDPFGF